MPPQVRRQPPHLFDQRAGNRVGLVPVGQRDDHRIAGGAVDEGDRGWGALRTRDHPPSGRPPPGCRPRSAARGMETMFRIRPRPCEDRLPRGRQSGGHSANGETCWRRIHSATACTHRGRSTRARPASPRHRDTRAAATGRFAAVTNRHPAWRRPRPATRRSRPVCSVSGAGPARTRPRRPPVPVRVAATVASDLPRYRRRRSVDAPGDRSCGEAGRDPTRDLLTLGQGQMIGPALPRDRRDPARLTQESPDPGHRLTQRALHLSDRITTTPHRPDQILLLDTNPTGPTPIPTSISTSSSACGDALTG